MELSNHIKPTNCLETPVGYTGSASAVVFLYLFFDALIGPKYTHSTHKKLLTATVITAMTATALIFSAMKFCPKE